MFVKRHPFIMMIEGLDAGGSGSLSSEEPETPTSDAEKSDDTAADTKDSNEDAADDGEEDWDRDRAMRKIRKINSENKSLRERTKAAEQAAQETPDLKAKNAELEATNLRLSVALELGLPGTLAARLQGSTREEVLADAEELLKLVGGKTPPSNKPVNGYGETHTNNSATGGLVDLDELASGFMHD